MPRGHKIDLERTAWMVAIGWHTDPASFVSREGKLLLHGDDWERMKQRVWLRDKGKCKLCKKSCWDGESAIADPDHIVKRSDGGGDELSNLRVLCRACHNARHPEKQVRFGKYCEQAVKDFEAIYAKGETNVEDHQE